MVQRDIAIIGVDWGTSNLRAVAMAADGTVLDERAAARGIMKVPADGFGAVLDETIAGWCADSGAMPPIVLSGMITSRQGWVETSYCACPCDAAMLSAAMVAHTVPDGRVLHFVPGLCWNAPDGTPDVMRGEETQLIGMLGRDAQVVCLPGTHSKWVWIEGGRIDRFRTYMTGEVFEALRDHTILGRLMETGGHAPDAFAAGLLQAARPGGLLNHLFSVRTNGLFQRLAAADLTSYLSGLLIGHELHAALVDVPAGTPVTLVGSPHLTGSYADALHALGRRTAIADQDAAARGQWALANAAGLIASGSAS